MSKIFNKRIMLSVLLAICSFLFFGCENETPVNDIYFDLQGGQAQMVLLVGQTLDIGPFVVVEPSYATNTSYSLTSLNSEVVSVSGNKLNALKEGSAIIKVVSNDNANKQDLMTVSVKNSKSTLSDPKNLTYNPDSQTFTFDRVINATNYTVSMNGQEINIGNSNTFALSSYDGDPFDKPIEVKVKANAPAYSYAYESSPYSTKLEIYQAGAIENLKIQGGTLSFDKINESNGFEIYFDNELIATLSATQKTFNLKEIDEKYAGKNVVIKVVSTVENKENYHKSVPVAQTVRVLDIVNPELNSSKLSWKSVVGAEKYAVKIEGVKVAETESSEFNLNTLPNYSSYNYQNGPYEIEVSPILNALEQNFANTNGKSILKFSRLDTPTIEVEEMGISWDSVLSATGYNISIESANGSVSLTNVKANEFLLNNYLSGAEYTIKLQSASDNLETEVYYIPSEFASKTLYKQTTVDPTIENYILSFDSVVGDDYLIEIEDEKGVVYQDTIRALNERYTLNLNTATFDFDAGNHQVKITHLGNLSYSINGDVTNCNFMQLAKIENATVDGHTVSVEKGLNNSQGKVVLKLNGGSLKEIIEIEPQNENYTFNTTDKAGELYLHAGDYQVEVYIVGDGSETFSYMENNVLVPSKTLNFSVKLLTPSLKFNSVTGIVSVEDPNGTDSSGNSLVSNYELSFEGTPISYNFTSPVALNVGENNFTVIAKSVGGTHLNSNSSQTLTITKIDHTSTIEIINNKIVITPANQSEEYALNVEFNFGGSKYTFTTQNQELICVGKNSLPYIYSDGKYEITIIDSETSNVILSEMENAFDVKVKFIAPHGENDTVATSDYASVTNLQITHLNLLSSVNVNQDNKLVLTLSDTAERRYIRVKFNNDVNQEYIEQTNSTLKNNSGKTLSFVYSDGTYTIDLLDSNYEPIIDAFKTNFTLQVKFTANPNGENSSIDGLFSSAYSVSVLNKAELSRNAQNLRFNAVLPTHTLSYYLLFVNKQNKISLTNENLQATINAGVVQFSFEKLALCLQEVGLNAEDVNSLQIVSLNLDSDSNNMILTSVSEEFKVERQSSVVITYSKDNNSADNSAYISFTTLDTSYSKYYSARITAYDDSAEKVLRFEDVDAVSGVISFRLDDNNVGKSLKVSAFVVTSGYYVDNGTIEVFNSQSSNVINCEMSNAVTELSVENNILKFNNVANTAGYEVYEKSGTVYTKLNETLLVTNSFDIDHLTGTKTLVVKSISTVGGTNSNYSEGLTVQKLLTPNISFGGGDIILTLATDTASLVLLEGVRLDLYVTTNIRTNSNPIIIDLSSKKLANAFVGNTLTISADEILSYNAQTLVAETVTFKYVVTYLEGTTPEIYCLNSNEAEYDCYGLFATSAPNGTLSDYNENHITEHISWTTSDKNVLSNLTVGYSFKIEKLIEGVFAPYYSTDSNLLYYNNGYYSYEKVIDECIFLFPDGYDLDESGAIETIDGKNERFDAGTYRIYIKTIPINAEDGLNVCSSKYSDGYEFVILNIPQPTTDNGTVTWNADANADKYSVVVRNNGEVKHSALVTDAQYTFDNVVLDDVSGWSTITVQSISEKPNVVSSHASKELEFYRLPKPTEVYVEDGQIIMTSNQLFSRAELTFTYTISKPDGSSENISVVVPYDHTSQLKNVLQGLGITDWSTLTTEQRNKLRLQTDNMIISNTNILNLLGGKTYSIDAQLFMDDGNDYPKLGIINSAKANSVSSLSTTKLKPSTNVVKNGVLKFDASDDYYDAVNSKYLNLNYNFNNKASVKDFWRNTIVYRVDVVTDSETVEIYAVDYYAFNNAITNGLLTTEDYQILDLENGLYAYVKFESGDNDIIFNIYKDNKINFKDYDVITYYKTVSTLKDNEFIYESENVTRTIDLINGGSFVAQVYLLGGDSFDNKAYLTSVNNDTNKFFRYDKNVLNTQDGKISFINQSPVNKYGVVDFPIYKLTITPINTSDSKIVYVYSDIENGLEIAKAIAQKEDKDNYLTGLYVVAEISLTDQSILFDMSKYFDVGVSNGVYNVTIKTLAGEGRGFIGPDGTNEDVNYLINSKTTVASTYFRSTNTNFTVGTDGNVHLPLSYIERDSKKSYNYKYEITLCELNDNGEIINTYVYEIDTSSLGVKIDEVNKKFIYALPSKISLKDGDVNIREGVKYTISAKALSISDNIVNGTYIENGELDIKKALGPTNVRIEDGVLKWEVPGGDDSRYTLLTITYDDGGSVKATKTISGSIKRDGDVYLYHYYDLNETYIVEGSNAPVEVLSGKDYQLALNIIGKTAVNEINSNATTSIIINRLNSVSATSESLISLDGNLIWTAVDGAIAYRVEIINTTDKTSYVYTTENAYLDTRIVADDNGKMLTSGNQNIFITALGDDILNAKKSVTVEGFKKLNSVENIRIEADGMLYWNAVEGAQGYEINFEYKNYSNEDSSFSLIVESDTLSCVGPDDINGTFIVNISAVGVGYTKIISSSYSRFESSLSVPYPVKELEYNSETFRYTWNVAEDFLNGDSLLVTYYYSTLQDSQNLNKVEVIINYKQAGYYDESASKYYLQLTKIGNYTNFSIQVKRSGALISNVVTHTDIVFDIFRSGSGTDIDPYMISNSTQLFAIEKFPNAHYKLTNSIDLSNEFNLATGRFNAGITTTYLICQNFAGVLDGDGYSIHGFATDSDSDILNLSGITSFALFKNLNGKSSSDRAIIKNLTIGAENIPINLVNSFAFDIENDVQLSMIAAGAKYALLDNVKVKDVRISINGKVSANKVKLSGLIANAENVEINNSFAKLTLETQIASSDISVGGLVAYGNKVSMSKSSATLIVASNNTTLKSVGGAIGYLVGTSSKNTFTQVKTEVDVSSVNVVYLGGVAGYATYTKFENCTTEGKISILGISNSVYIGGIVGSGGDANILSSSSSIEFKLSVTNVNQKYIGAIVGNLIKYTTTASVEGCEYSLNSNCSTKSVVTTTSITIGIYGDLGENVSYSE